MTPRLRILISNTHNPWFNLATEDWIFKQMNPEVQTLFLWRNKETVVIGRNQNPWSECNLARMETDGVHLARRTSGGGAVYQDLGNTCFTFLSPRSNYNRAKNLEIILSALRKFDLHGEASGRNDLVLPMEDGPRKFSGSAFRETRDRCFHHGTLLIEADLSRLANYLTPHPKKLQSKGKASVRSRVMNLSEKASSLDHDSLSQAIIESFFEHHKARCEIETLDSETTSNLPGLKTQFEEFASWEWRFGHAPKFEQQMAEYLSWGFFEVHVDSEHGQFSRVRIFSDSLVPHIVEDLEQSLVGKPLHRDGINSALESITQMYPEYANELSEFAAWISNEVEV